MKRFMAFTVMILLACTAQAKIRHVVIDPAGGGTQLGTQSRWFVEKNTSLVWAKALSQALDKQRMDTTLTRFEDYPVPPFERVSIANQQKNAVFVSLHLATHPSQTQIKLFTMQAIRSEEQESVFLIPLSKAHNPWVARSELLAQTMMETLPPVLSPQHVSLTTPAQSLLGINQPAVMLELQVYDGDFNARSFQTLIDDLATRIAIAIKSFTKKERKL